MSKRIPKKLQRVLWSYDISKMNLDSCKDLVVQQVLNYGVWGEVVWLFRTYSIQDIKRTVGHPRRGVWFINVLNFWCQFFKIKLPRDVWERALFRVGPVENMSIYKKTFD